MMFMIGPEMFDTQSLNLSLCSKYKATSRWLAELNIKTGNRAKQLAWLCPMVLLADGLTKYKMAGILKMQFVMYVAA